MIRADGSASLGMGHINRCIALAETCAESDIPVWFACHDPDPVVTRTLQCAGFPVMEVACSEDHPEIEARDTAQLASELKVEWLLIDHPAIDIEKETIMRQYFPHAIVVIDGRYRPHCCDTLINPNAFASLEKCRATVPMSCQVLAGYRYFLLQDKYLDVSRTPEFTADPLQQIRQNPGRPRVLVTLGGADPANCTLRICQHLDKADMDPHQPVFDIVAGTTNPHKQSLKDFLATATPGRFVLHDAPPDLVNLLKDCTLCISAAGITLGEAAYLARPLIGVAILEDQVETIDALKTLGVLEASGIDDIADKCRRLLDAPDRRRELSASASALVDGRGKLRIADSLWNR